MKKTADCGLRTHAPGLLLGSAVRSPQSLLVFASSKTYDQEFSCLPRS